MTDATIIDILPRRAQNLAKIKRWRGLGRNDARALDVIDHLRQSILDILTTYPGERIMRPEYGSRIRDLIDRPVNAQWLADLYFCVAQAITRWEPRVRVQKVAATMEEPGRVTIDLTLRIRADESSQEIRIEL